MYLIRDVFNTKPGRAKDLVAKFKQAMPHMRAPGVRGMRVMTDTVADYWTVVVETEVEDLQAYFDMDSTMPASPELEETMKGYKELVNGGHREIFRIE
jgi:heme-degrading monooxygenase HmoA